MGNYIVVRCKFGERLTGGQMVESGYNCKSKDTNQLPTPSEASELSSLLEVISFIVGILNPYGERIERVETIITYLKQLKVVKVKA